MSAAVPDTCSDMRVGYSTLSVEPAFKVLADSAPYCLFRNKEAYQLGSGDTRLRQGKGSQFTENKRTDDQVRLFNDSLSGEHIPSYLLYGTLRRDDAAASTTPPPSGGWSTIAAVQHNHNSLFAHVSGRCLDQIVLRDVSHSYTGLDLRNPPGFTLPLGNGSSIQEIVHAGTTHWGSSSLLLAHTRAEVFQLRTVSLEDVQTKPQGTAVKYTDNINVLTTVLDPVQKWQLPHEICSTSTYPGAWNASCFLTACGRVCTWNPTDGVQLAAAGASVLPTDCLGSGMRDYSMRIDCTLHPQVSHIVCDKAVYLFDLRAAATAATRLYATARQERALCSAQHGGAGQCFVVSTKNCVSLIDTRFTKTPLAQQYIPVGHERMKYVMNPLTPQSGIFLGASRGSAQLFAHSLEHVGQRQAPDGSESDAHEAAQRLLSASRACGSEEAVRWDVDGFPVVDAGTAETSLLGFHLIPLVRRGASSANNGDASCEVQGEMEVSESDSDSEQSQSSDDSDPRARFERRRRVARKAKKISSAVFRQSSRRCDPAHLHSALLLQQSHRGDVFAQRVNWSVNPFRNARLGLEPSASAHDVHVNHGRLTTSGALSVAASVVRKAPVRKTKRKRPAHYRGSDDESSEEESSSGEEENQQHASTVSASQQLQLSHGSQLLLASQWSGLPPVQLQLPCGVRCHPSQQGRSPASADAAQSGSHKRESALKATKKYLKTMIRNNGLILQNAISVRDSNPSDNAHNTALRYPSVGSAFSDFVPEDTLHGFDLIKMFPEDLRVDLPTLPTHTALVMKQTSAAVQARSAVDYIVQHYKIDVLSYLEKEPKTLWEIWKFLLVKTEGKRLEINQLRQSLRSNHGLIETCVPSGNLHAAKTGVAKTRKDSISDEDSEGSQISREVEDTAPPAALSETRPRTFDGLYVRESSVDRVNLEKYRDSSKGFVVRMGRRPALDACTPVQRCCSCSASNLETMDLAKLILCGEKGCIVPHTLVFRIDRSYSTAAESSNNAAASLPPRGRAGGISTANNKAATAKAKTEVFYWGSSLAPATVPASTVPVQLSQSQSQSQPMSQLRFQLSQLSQNSAQTPFSQPSQSFTPAPRVPATPGTKAAAPTAPEVNLDVTDNILAVLSNNWNRSLDHTGFVDPARTSLLQAWAPR